MRDDDLPGILDFAADVAKKSIDFTLDSQASHLWQSRLRTAAIREAILRDVNKPAEAVEVTPGLRGRNVVSARLLPKRRLSRGGVQCYGSPGVNRVSRIELAARIGAMLWNGSSALFCSPAAAAVVIYGPSNSVGLLIAKYSGDGVDAGVTCA